MGENNKLAVFWGCHYAAEVAHFGTMINVEGNIV